ncbi:MAG TPA: PQQ-dependent sugar dehydrogenase [Candidatus Paceibacterota bacterium]
MSKKAIVGSVLAAFVVIVGGVAAYNNFGIGSTYVDVNRGAGRLEERDERPAGAPTVLAKNLYVPWAVAFLLDGSMLVTERSGTLKLIKGESVESIKIPGVVERGEGGLLDVIVHPDFAQNKFIYLYFTTSDSGQTVNKVVRYTFGGADLGSFKEDKVILGNIPGGTNHNGGRAAFGPDGMLYVLTGDAGRSELAQDRASLAGKILRINYDGSIPSDNPFGTAVYSYGHRNPQGLAWDDKGRLWQTDHGRSGLQSGFDELNLIEKGGNYGWPVIQGDEKKEGMKAPMIHSGANTTWAPSGLSYMDGALYFAGLRGQALYKVDILEGDDGSATFSDLVTYFKGTYGRLREVTNAPDGSLVITTSNRDGRGSVQAEDDKILKWMK